MMMKFTISSPEGWCYTGQIDREFKTITVATRYVTNLMISHKSTGMVSICICIGDRTYYKMIDL